MMKFSDDGGSNGANTAAMSKLMQRKMMEQMFGLSAEVRPILAEAASVGDDENGSFGVLGLRLYAATMTSPTPKLYLQTNGKLLVHPDAINEVVRFLQRIELEFQEKYSQALEDAKNLEGAELFGAAMGMDTKELASG